MRITLAACLMLALLALAFGNLVTRLFTVLVLLTALNGYWLGATKSVASVGGMLIAMLLAVPLGTALEGIVGAIVGSGGLTNRMISIGAWAVIVTAVVTVILSLVVGRTLKKRQGWRRLDKLLGIGLGVLDGVILGVILLWVVFALEPMAAANLARARDGQHEVEPSSTAKAVVALASAAQKSTVGRAAEAANPLKNMRIIRLFADAQTVLNDPFRRELFLNDTRIQDMQRRPSVQKALELLSGGLPDVDLDDGLSSEELHVILASPEFLAVLDETGLLAELSPLAGEIEQALRFAIEYEP
jgi:hypothetical protein